jgi:hypothetical protein
MGPFFFNAAAIDSVSFRKSAVRLKPAIPIDCAPANQQGAA